MDGTIVDTEPHWQAAQRALLIDHGIAPFDAEGEAALVGASLQTAARIFREAGVPLDEDAWIAHVTTDVLARVRAELTWRPGARELLVELRDAGVPSALVTNSFREMAEVVLAAIGVDWLDAVVTGDDVAEGKPDPGPYLRAAELLGVRPGDCIAIEDSVPGLASARRAGAVTLGVPHGMALDEGHADALATSLTEIDLEGLRALYTRVRTERDAVTETRR
ncbi:HAD family phosphatase [Pseudoclavibacter chungangensis]|uniref:HAD family phosphatase n=2 Tax=Pseudoclavibacter chungangensis TaxID=587635 RepID=A0A7J5BZV6_9MICO|nr:HAD family phosphatase [Pseudoclavibacter chungangensis]